MSLTWCTYASRVLYTTSIYTYINYRYTRQSMICLVLYMQSSAMLYIYAYIIIYSNLALDQFPEKSQLDKQCLTIVNKNSVCAIVLVSWSGWMCSAAGVKCVYIQYTLLISQASDRFLTITNLNPFIFTIVCGKNTAAIKVDILINWPWDNTPWGAEFTP